MIALESSRDPNEHRPTTDTTSYKHQPNPSTQLTVTMKYSVSAVAFASLAAHAAAQGCNVKVDPNKQSGNPVRAPLTEIVPAGTPYTITWDVSTRDPLLQRERR